MGRKAKSVNKFRGLEYDDEPDVRLPRWLDHLVVLGVAVCAVVVVVLR